MATHNKIKQLENRAERTHYDGKFKDFQAFGDSYFGKRYSESSNKNNYSDYQNFLYKRALYGIKVYTPAELKKMSPLKIERINKVHERSWKILNVWKQQIMIQFTNDLLSLFKKSALAEDIINTYSKPDPNFNCSISFKELNISKEMVINKLLENKALPKNFYELK